MADWLAKDPRVGGLGLGDGPVTAVGLLVFAALVAYLAITHSDVEGSHGKRHHEVGVERHLDVVVD